MYQKPWRATGKYLWCKYLLVAGGTLVDNLVHHKGVNVNTVDPCYPNDKKRQIKAIKGAYLSAYTFRMTVILNECTPTRP